ncbi:MAG: LysR family transcriptional regulator [Thermodesulfobacteriota bacterium]
MIDQISGDFLQWLRGFYFVVEKGSLTKAAIAMGRQQPTITHQIKCLEKVFGVCLFDRSSGKVKLTPEGRILFEKAISFFELLKETRSELGRGLVEYQNKISIAVAGHAVVDFFLPRYIIAFRQFHPLVVFNIESGLFETFYETIELGEADFGIGSVDAVPKCLVYHELFKSRLRLIAPKNNTWVLGKAVTLKQIAQIPFIVFSRTGSTTATSVARRFSEEGLKPNVVITQNDFVSVKNYVALGLGVSIVSEYTISEEDKKTLNIYPLDQYFPERKYGLFLRKRKYLSPTVKAFIRTIKPEIQFT